MDEIIVLLRPLPGEGSFEITPESNYYATTQDDYNDQIAEHPELKDKYQAVATFTPSQWKNLCEQVNSFL